MSAERRRVLELVAGGKLTVEQASELMAALDEPSRAPGRGPGPMPRPDRPGPPPRPERFGNAGQAGSREESPYDRIVALGKYGISPEYVRELQEAGLGELSLEQVIALGKYGVRAKDVRGFYDAGLDDLKFEHILRFGKYGIRPEYVRGFVEQGLLGDLKVRALRPDDRVAADPYKAEPDTAEPAESGSDDERE